MTKEMQLHALELEIDAEGIKKILQNAINYVNHEFATLINEVATLLNGNWNVSLLNVKRVANVITHHLVTHGRCMDDSRIVHVGIST